MFTAPVFIAIVVVLLIAIGTIGARIHSRTRTTIEKSPAPTEPTPPRPEEENTDVAPTSEKNFRDRFGLEELSKRLQVPREQLHALVPQYRTVEIPKPRGGVRRLEIPDAATMEIQRKILRQLLKMLDAHPFACGFEEGTSIVDAALPHEGKQIVVKMDIRRFFESTTAERVQRYFENIGWTKEGAEILVRFTTFNGHLPQGAPSSPRLSNLVNAPLDEGLLRLARKHNGHYSRYADDITMSFDNFRGRKIRGLTQVVRRILRSYGYSMHGGRKLNILRQHQQQRVLGLVVNSRVALPRKTRRWIRAVKHHLDNGQPASISADQLQGWESLAAMVQKQRSE